MYRMIMDHNEALQASACVEPVVFMARDGDYEVFRQHAEMTDRGASWVAWSEDEECPQAGVANDVEMTHAWTPWCSLGTPPPPTMTCAEDAFEDDDSMATARSVGAGTVDGAVCGGDSDYFAITATSGSISALLTFDHSAGDLDMVLQSSSGEIVSSSTGSSDTEQIERTTAAGETYYLHVYGYSGAEGQYQLTIELR